jgi:predicted transcriptional regulator
MSTDHTFLGGLKPMGRVLGEHQDYQNAWDQHVESEVVVVLDRQGEDQMLGLQLE